MRSLTSIAALLALAPVVLSSEQLPLSSVDHNAPASSHDDAPPYREELLKLHEGLISIPSISGTEAEVGEWIIDYLTRKGYNTKKQPVEPRDNTPEDGERFNILAWLGSSIYDAKVLVTSHIDVVPPHIPYAIDDGPVTKDTMIRGRGSVDAKASVAAMSIAVDELIVARKIDPKEVMLLWVVGEEVGGEGILTFNKESKAMDPPLRFDAAIFGEPTENKLVCAHKGGLFCEIKAKGLGGHSGYPWLGKSANELLVRALAKMIDTDLGSSKEVGNTTVNIGQFNGGIASNVIPEDATASIAVRVAIGPQKSGHKIVREKIQAILDEVDDEAFTLTCTPGYGVVRMRCDVADFETIVVNYGTDVPHLEGDHDRYLYGPGTILVAHGARENLTVADLETSVDGYQKLILHALKK